MCGIAGIVDCGNTRNDMLPTLKAMTDALCHRGPDDSGTWQDLNIGVGFAHTRLSIIDLSQGGHQPMTSANGRYTIIYNGEIYNYVSLRDEISARSETHWLSTSDTEVILAAIEQWGVEGAVSRFNGMFAFAVWDKHDRKLFLVRDRIGIKPLYYGWIGARFVFGSELKAIQQHPKFDGRVDRNVLALYLKYNYVPSPHSIYKGIRKLSPGHILEISVPRSGSLSPESERIFSYWNILMTWGDNHDNIDSEESVTDALEDLLTDAVRIRMISDVPLGAFLSGGIDSSLIVALMQSVSTTPVRTFTIGFDDYRFDEAHAARAIAKHLRTQHEDLYVQPTDLLDLIPNIPRYWDEPFADSSQIPTQLLAQLTRKHVTVALSGDGGDELFTGYPRYLSALRWKQVMAIPLPLRIIAGRLGTSICRILCRCFGFTAAKLAEWRFSLLESRTVDNIQEYVSDHREVNDLLLTPPKDLRPLAILSDSHRASMDPLKQMQIRDISTYLPDDILTKVDRASMSIGLEARTPILDHRVLEFAGRVPASMNIRERGGKSCLRTILSRHLPPDLMSTKKMGFAVPLGQWLRGPLRPWAEELIDEKLLKDQGYFNTQIVRDIWKAALDGRRGWERRTWNIIMFQAWLQEYH